jgi:nitronate monooxygenase
MFLVSSPALVLATCEEGVLGSFPAHSTRTREQFEDWLLEIKNGLESMRAETPGRRIAPFAVNLVTHPSNLRMEGDLTLCIKHRVPIVLTSKGAPTEAVKRIHDYGGIVFHDVASRRHVKKAMEAGVDGIIVVSQGAGGHTGTINPFALMNEVRSIYRGPVALAGCINTGRDILAAQAMGADFAYIGTPFIATTESLAPQGHKDMIVNGESDDVFFTASLDGAPANFLSSSLTAAGIDLDVLRTTLPGQIVSAETTSKRWKDIWSAGQGIGSIHSVVPAAALVRRLKLEYRNAADRFRQQLPETRNAMA